MIVPAIATGFERVLDPPAAMMRWCCAGSASYCDRNTIRDEHSTYWMRRCKPAKTNWSRWVRSASISIAIIRTLNASRRS